MALTASFQNLDDTILIESDSYARSETYTQAETGAAITAAIDALNLSQYRTEAQVQALIAGELEVSTYVAGELANYATSSSVTSAISSALSSYDNSSQVDSKIVTALLDFYTQTEVDQQIANALGNVDLSSYYTYYTQAETQSYVTNELLAFYPRTELDSQLTATFTQYWTSSRTQTEIDDAIAGAGFLTQAQADTRYFAVSANGSFESLVRTNVTPPQIKALLPRAPLAASTILTDTTLELTCDAYTKAESDGRYLSSSSFAPLDARYFARNPAVAEGNGLFHLVQDQFTPQFIRSLLFRPPLTGGAILGNGSVIEIEADCWSKAQSDGRYPLVATFNSLGSTVTSIDGRVTALENAPGVAPTTDLTVNSLTATSFVQTPLLQSAAADLQIRNATTTLRAEDGTLLASFAAGSIGLEQDITVRSDRTLNATTADFAQFFVGSTAATGAFTSSSSITATQQIESDLRVQAPLLRCDPAASVLTVTGGTQGVLVDDTLRVNGAIAPEASLPFLSLTGGSSGVQVLSPLLEQIAVAPNSSVGIVARNAAATGDASLILDSNAQNGLVELKALAGGGVQMNTLFQFMSFNTTNGLANLAIEPNIGGSNNGELIFGYGFVNLSDKALKTNVRDLSEKELQETFDAVEPRMYDRIEGGKDQIGFIAQEVQATPLGERVCKTKNLDGRELMTLDYQKLNVVLWGVVKSLQKRIEKKKRGVAADQGNEFRGLEGALSEPAVHREKLPSDRNATAVIDRAIQTLKKDLAGKVARDGGGWAEHVAEVTEAYNARPHQAVTVGLEDVETKPAATPEHPEKFEHNKNLTEGRQRRLEEAGAFRAPTNAARSFQPQYGAVRELAGYDSMTVRAATVRRPCSSTRCPCRGDRESRGDGSRGRPSHWRCGSCGTPTPVPSPRLDRGRTQLQNPPVAPPIAHLSFTYPSPIVHQGPRRVRGARKKNALVLPHKSNTASRSSGCWCRH